MGFPHDEAQAMQADGHTPTSGSAEKNQWSRMGMLGNLTESYGANTFIRRDISK